PIFWVLLGGCLENRAEALAWAAPVCPEVQQDDAFLADGVLEVLASDFLRSHVFSLSLHALCFSARGVRPARRVFIVSFCPVQRRVQFALFHGRRTKHELLCFL